jgi:type IV fimbrial biogenesis protein FimT
MRTSRFPGRHRSFRSRGFTLIELMVTVAVLVVLMAVGVPSFRSFVQSQKVKSASFELMSALVVARSEAVKRNTDVKLEPDTEGAWASGWAVKYGAGPTTVLKQAALPGLTITGPTSVIYKGTGRAGGSANFTVTGDSSVKCVMVDSSGIASTKQGACS